MKKLKLPDIIEYLNDKIDALCERKNARKPAKAGKIFGDSVVKESERQELEQQISTIYSVIDILDPNGKYLEKYTDIHLGCQNWPNCDSVGCGNGK